MTNTHTTWQRGAVLGLCLAITAAPLALASAAGAAGTEPGTPAAHLPSFYAVPDPLPSDRPGTLIKSEKVKTSAIDGTVYRIMYVSENTEEHPTAVTGLVMVPPNPPPTGGYKVVTWGHGTNGMAPQCAPSLKPSTAVPYQNDLLQQGWEVVASDYEGEGTPGPLPYLVGVLAARNTIDIVRAAHEMRDAHASATYAVWGHSEGGQTAMFALHIAQSYAPDLHLVGVVAGAPPSQFSVIYTFLKTSPYRFYLYMAAIGFNAGYGKKNAPLTEVMTPSAQKLIPDLAKGCFTYLERTFDHYSLTDLVKTDPFSVPKWKALLNENDPETFTAPSSAPLLMPQGGSDEQIPTVSTQLLTTHLCKIGQDVERWIYPGQSHAGVIQYYVGDMVHWLSDRFAGDPDPDPYQPVGLPGVQTSTCPT
jgi:pimeloyl-ACP methyl ester carboxylesterase